MLYSDIVSLFFYAVVDRAPRVYPWVNEPGGVIVSRWTLLKQVIAYTGCSIMLCGYANTADGS